MTQYNLIKLNKAADRGDIIAMIILGDCYYYGNNGAVEDKEAAAQWYHEAAERGNPDAQNKLATCYAHGWGVEQNNEKAAYWYREAAKRRHANAENLIGQCNFNAKRVEHNKVETVKWYKKSVEKALVEAKDKQEFSLYDKITTYVEQIKKKTIEWWCKFTA